jgi:RIO kinase 1
MTRDEQELLLSMLDGFVDSGLITDQIQFVRGGKEATVFCCRAGKGGTGARRAGGGGAPCLAAKVYRPRRYRRFRNDADYQDGRVIPDARARRAVKKRSDFGHQVHQGRWVAAEFETQQMLFAAGVDVPRPIDTNGDAIVMEWIGDGSGVPAPQLQDVRLDPRDAGPMLHRLLENVRILLAHNRIHGDLSPFNVLVWQGRPIVIDFPQAVDPRMNRNAYMLLHRDIEHLCRHFDSRYGLTENATAVAAAMWSQFVNGRL